MMVPPEAVPALMRERLGCPRCKVLVAALTDLRIMACQFGDFQYRAVVEASQDMISRIDAAIASHKPCPTCRGTGWVSEQLKVVVNGVLGAVDSFHDVRCPACAGGKKE